MDNSDDGNNAQRREERQTLETRLREMAANMASMINAMQNGETTRAEEKAAPPDDEGRRNDDWTRRRQ